jgi:uncharacterized membrane protein (UPF0182 family)
MRRPGRPRVQRRWIIIGGIVLVLFISISSLVRFYTDLLWFGELNFTSVFWRIFWARAGFGIVGGLLAGILVYVNLEVARRAAPRYRFVGPGDDVAEQYRSAFRPYARLANIVLAAVVAFFTGLSTSGSWERFLLWRNGVPFGVDAPAPFGRDVSFYVFDLPFQRTVISWLFGVLIVSLLLAGVAHLFNGSIQPEANRIRVATVVRVHVSAILGVIALLKAWAYSLDQYDLVYSARGAVRGASYTDVNAQRPALRVLMIIAIVVAIIFFVNVFRFQGWLLPGAALGLWAFSSILLGAIVPAAVQRFTVVPNESQRERPYIQKNIQATRQGFGLDTIKVDRFPAQETLSSAVIDQNQGTIRNIRVWDPTVLYPTYQRLQAIRTYYDFDDVDIDRYALNKRMTQVMLSAREVDPSKLSPNAQNWVNTKLTYTHGYGIVANQANSITREGLPDFIARDLPQKGEGPLKVTQPAIYFGQRTTDYAVVNTKQREIDYPSGEQEIVTTRYRGTGGIRLSNFIRRLAFAIRFGDTDLAISSFITPQSRVMMTREIGDRARSAAPFLQYDGDPYLVTQGGKLYWVMDAYTSTDRFPYSDRVDLASISATGNLRGTSNYIRNSVKVVIDAYEGTMRFYLVDPNDALAATYQKIFPSLFTPGDQMPAGLRAHLRYPEDLFKVQAAQYRDYHILDPQRLYEREDVWDIPKDPTSEADAAMNPYYVVMKLPDTDEEEFLLMLPFTPRGRPGLNGWMAARMDPEHYGEMIAFSFPRGVQIDGPENIAARIQQNGAISNQFTLWEGAGSNVVHGNLLVIPIGKALIYVQPIYLRAAREAQSLPELRRVIVVIGDQIGFEPTLQEALDAALRGQPPTVTEGEEPRAPEEPAAPGGNLGELLSEAMEHFENADAALREGDLATYQRETEAGRRAVEQAQRQSSS